MSRIKDYSGYVLVIKLIPFKKVELAHFKSNNILELEVDYKIELSEEVCLQERQTL